MSEKSNHLLELVMFDIAYVISNCDYEYSSDERKYLDIILDRYDNDDKELLKLRTQFLDSILEKGIDEVKSFVTNLSKSLKNKIDDNMKDAYLALFKEVIMLDENVHDNERVLYQLLCDQWRRESGL
jgi:t-SNARE complex subunit (syntaxin)